MADLDDLRRYAAADQGLATVSVSRTDGSIHSSVVNAGVMDHPVRGEPVVALVVRGDARKLALVRAGSRLSVVWRSGWRWAGAEGPTDVIGPDDPADGFDPEAVPQLLRDVFVAAGGSHDDWDTYDRVMAAERRTAVFMAPERIIGVP